MTAWRNVASLVVVLAATGIVSAQTYPLLETPQAGDCAQFHLKMSLTGEMHITKDDKPMALKLSALATHDFPERILAVSPSGLPLKAARVYETAQATIQVGASRSERTLRPDRTMQVMQRPKDHTLIYCPKGPLTREEHDLTNEHFDTLALTGLLPGKPVALKDTWKLATEVVQAICHFEGVTSQDLMCTLAEVKDNTAQVTVAGSVAGIDLGALVKVSVQASYQFDLNRKRLTTLEWKQKDDRGQGPVSPAAVVETTCTLTRTPIEQPESLSDVALFAVPSDFEPPLPMLQLSYHDPKSRFDLLYGREWFEVGQTDERLVLRLLDRGEFVAQATITPWVKAPAGEHLAPEAFQKSVSEMPGWQPAEVLQTGVVPSADSPGRWVYRVSAVGEMDGLKVLQNFYLVAGPGGDQVVIAFTMTHAQAEKLGSRDLSLVGSLELPEKK